MINKYRKKWMIPTLLFFSATIFLADQIRKMGGIKDIFDIDDEDDL
jgi:hypothetical protein